MRTQAGGREEALAEPAGKTKWVDVALTYQLTRALARTTMRLVVFLVLAAASAVSEANYHEELPYINQVCGPVTRLAARATSALSPTTSAGNQKRSAEYCLLVNWFPGVPPGPD